MDRINPWGGLSDKTGWVRLPLGPRPPQADPAFTTVRSTGNPRLVRLSIQLFALARDKAGRSVVPLELPDGANVADLRAALAAGVPALAPLVPVLLIAVDSEYARDEVVLRPESQVAAFPPVSGGTAGGVA